MIFVELIAVAGTMASILGVFLAMYGRSNNRLLKEESQHTREILNSQKEILTRIEEGQKETRKDAAEARREMAEAFRRIEEGQSAARREMAEAQKEMAEAIKYLGDLIRAEGERTRQAIRVTPA